VKAGRILLMLGIAISAAAVVLAVLPFRAHIPIHAPIHGGTELSVRTLRSSCGAPVTSAWHAEHTTYLAFSAANPEAPAGVGCTKPARERLGFAAVGFVLGLLLVLSVALGARRRGPT